MPARAPRTLVSREPSLVLLVHRLGVVLGLGRVKVAALADALALSAGWVVGGTVCTGAAVGHGVNSFLVGRGVEIRPDRRTWGADQALC